MKRLGFAAASVVLAAAALIAAPGAGASATTPVRAIPCRGTMSNSTPQDFSKVFVLVHWLPHARVTTVAHFFNKVNVVHTGMTGPRGNAAIAYRVGAAKPGFTVVVDIHVVKGLRNGNCRTKFTPR
jgi:hypothetical protein